MKIVPANRKRNVLWPMIRMGKGLSTGVMAARYRSALKLLYTTKRGSIVWAPTFGVIVHQLRTQSITDEQRDFVVMDTRQTTEVWIPDIVVVDISVNKEPDSEHLDIMVSWGIPDAGRVGTSAPYQRGFSFGPIHETITV